MEQPPLGLTTRAKMVRVIDGDTVDVELRLPCRVRLLDCWAPEPRQAGGQRATQQLRMMAPEGSELVVHIPTSEADSLKDVMTFGRVLGHVWREGDCDSLSVIMTDNGFATTERKRESSRTGCSECKVLASIAALLLFFLLVCYGIRLWT